MGDRAPLGSSVTAHDVVPGPPPLDDELAALALAADPDTVVGADAVCLWDLGGHGSVPLLPEWYMPAPSGGRPLLRGWRRRLVFIIIAAFILINAYGLCSTYGRVELA